MALVCKRMGTEIGRLISWGKSLARVNRVNFEQPSSMALRWDNPALAEAGGINSISIENSEQFEDATIRIAECGKGQQPRLHGH